MMNSRKLAYARAAFSTAIFIVGSALAARPSIPLTVEVQGDGRVSSPNNSISCPTICTASYKKNSQVTLSATAGTDSQFVQWQGACTGTQPTCVLQVRKSTHVTALFEAIQPSPTLTSVSVSPAMATVTVGDTQRFTATGLDQYGSPLPETFDWTVTGGGSIDASGNFAASATGGPITVTATSTVDGSISGTAEVTVVDSNSVENLAVGQPVAVSSTEVLQLEGDNAVDDSTTTRWSSQFADPQWIYVDLGGVYPISRVVLNWERAFGQAYQIQVSNDASTWNTVFTETAGDGGIDGIAFPTVDARYVRMYGTQRGTSWGYSLWEFAVYGVAEPYIIKLGYPAVYVDR